MAEVVCDLFRGLADVAPLGNPADRDTGPGDAWASPQISGRREISLAISVTVLIRFKDFRRPADWASEGS